MIREFGERALLVELDGWEQAQALASMLLREPLSGVESVVPGLASVLVELRPAERPEPIRDAISRRLEGLEARQVVGRTRVVPVVYGGEHGPDLEAAASSLGLAPAGLADRHAGLELRVMFCGFAPGFAYLGELPPELRVPRLETPRTHTVPGSVAIAGPMTGIYPADLPGGWRVIGRTPLTLFDVDREPPAYLAPGDTVRFRAMDPGEWATAGAPADW